MENLKEIFVQKAIKLYGNKYDYSESNYINCKAKIKIFCNICHNYFLQTPDKFLNSQRGCPFCSKRVTDLDSFITKAQSVHGNKYDYSLVDYKDTYSKIKIICKTCKNVFLQRMNNHLNGQGCPYCNKKFDTNSFIIKAKNVHGDKYDYSKTIYKNSLEKIKIICPKHGIFEQYAFTHLQGSGCPICKESLGEKEIAKYLEGKGFILNKSYFREKRFDDCKDKNTLPFDFYIPSLSLLIEYNGEQHYKNVDFFGGYNAFLLRKHHDWLKRKYARENNIKLLVIKYNENIKQKLIL